MSCVIEHFDAPAGRRVALLCLHRPGRLAMILWSMRCSSRSACLNSSTRYGVTSDLQNHPGSAPPRGLVDQLYANSATFRLYGEATDHRDENIVELEA